MQNWNRLEFLDLAKTPKPTIPKHVKSLKCEFLCLAVSPSPGKTNWHWCVPFLEAVLPESSSFSPTIPPQTPAHNVHHLWSEFYCVSMESKLAGSVCWKVGVYLWASARYGWLRCFMRDESCSLLLKIFPVSRDKLHRSFVSFSTKPLDDNKKSPAATATSSRPGRTFSATCRLFLTQVAS